MPDVREFTVTYAGNASYTFVFKADVTTATTVADPFVPNMQWTVNNLTIRPSFTNLPEGATYSISFSDNGARPFTTDFRYYNPYHLVHQAGTAHSIVWRLSVFN
eukprot:TRINITY_DN103_c0_g1_i2.p1 TRINITY_DN103_c0_g1~~TRINITY_DN103_c0_g1_i2.p1  ORF type:complete len:104 (+),score=3.31 TRINITY_DN103_c0_g1_i2:81-392(+)